MHCNIAGRFHNNRGTDRSRAASKFWRDNASGEARRLANRSSCLLSARNDVMRRLQQVYDHSQSLRQRSCRRQLVRNNGRFRVWTRACEGDNERYFWWGDASFPCWLCSPNDADKLDFLWDSEMPSADLQQQFYLFSEQDSIFGEIKKLLFWKLSLQNATEEMDFTSGAISSTNCSFCNLEYDLENLLNGEEESVPCIRCKMPKPFVKNSDSPRVVLTSWRCHKYLKKLFTWIKHTRNLY